MIPLVLVPSFVVTTACAAAPPPPREPHLVVSEAMAIAVGDIHACAVTKSGRVSCWGDGRYHQTGRSDGGTHGPLEVRGIDDARRVSAGLTTTCFVKQTGEVACIGARLAPMSGEASEPLVPVPVVVYPASRWARDIAVGQKIAVLSAAGEVDFFDAPIGEPVPEAGFQGAAQVAAGFQNICARMSDGSAKCLGPNWGGEDGNGGDREHPGTDDVLAPREPTPEILATSYEQCHEAYCQTRIAEVVDIDMFGRMACVALASGRVACWGGNDDAAPVQLGKLGFSRAPLLVRGIDAATKVAVGGDFVCALTKSGAVSCWGRNEREQLGAPGKSREEPRSVALPEVVTEVEAGLAYACALTVSGQVFCWGDVTNL